MPTPYSSVYEIFSSKVSDYSFVDMTLLEFESVCKTYLRSAIVKFRHCKKDLADRDEALMQFNADLTDEEKEILAILMVVEWLTPAINDTKLLKQVLSDKDFRIYSQSQHLREVTYLRDKMKKEANQLMMDYSFGGEDLSGLT